MQAKGLLHLMAAEHVGGARVAISLGGAGVAPGGGVIAAHGIDFGQGGVGGGELGVEPHGFEQQAERLILAAFDAVELGQVKIRARIGGLASDPGPLFGHVAARLAAERDLHDLVAPETHAGAPISMICTSATLVLVGPVMTRSPRGAK